MKFRWEIIPAGAAVLLGAGLALTTVGVGTLGTGWDEPADSGDTGTLADLHQVAPAEASPFGVTRLDPGELAAAILAGEPGLTIVDVRAGDVAPADRLPMAYWLPLSDPSWAAPGPFPEHRRVVIVATDDNAALAAWSQITKLGYPRVAILAGGQPAWNARYDDPQEPAGDATTDTWSDYRQRKAVSLYLAGGVDALTSGAATGGGPQTVAPPPLPVRTTSTGPKAAEGC
jgi:rhodanese-related sulfurtransferase